LFAHAALLAAIALGVQPAGGAAIDPPAFIHALERAADATRRAASVEEASASIPLRWTVRADAGPIVVDTAWVRQEFAAATPESWPSIRLRVANRLDNMRREAADAHLDIGGDPRAALADTLATKEFERAQASNWLEQIRSWISEWLLRLFTRIFGASSAGDLREAVRCGFHAAVRRLEEQGSWSVDDARTPREYMRLLHGDDPRRTMFGDLTRRFEQVWYGHRSATGEDVRHIAAHLERLGCLRPGEQAN